MPLKKCSACARAIRETAIACDYCGQVASPPTNIALDAGGADPEQLLLPVDGLPAEAGSAAEQDQSQAEHAESHAGQNDSPVASVRREAAIDLTERRSRRLPLVAGAVAVGTSVIVAVAMIGVRGPVATPRAASPEPTPPRVEPRLPPAAPPSVVPARISAGPTWSTANSAAWVGNSRQSVAFELSASAKVHAWLKEVQPRLVVRCLANATDVFVFTETAARMERQDSNHTVTIQLDGAAETIERWPDSADHDALFAPDGPAFARRLLGAQSLRFGFTPHNAPPVVASFDVTGLAELMRPVARFCGSSAR
jgi:hypothetical protein